MISAESFLDQISATTQYQSNIKRSLMGYIDPSFNTDLYPSEWPKVVIDGQGLSDRTYPCLSSYYPLPGDRVVMHPVGSSYVVLGAVQDNPTPRLTPGSLVFSAYSQQNQSIGSGSANAAMVIWDNVQLDLLGGWVGHDGFDDFRTRYQPTIPGWYTFRGTIGWDDAGVVIADDHYRSANWVVNGSNPTPSASRTSPVDQNHTSNTRTISYFMDGANDYIELEVAQFSGGGSLSLIINTFAPHMEVVYAGPGSLNELLPSVE